MRDKNDEREIGGGYIITYTPEMFLAKIKAYYALYEDLPYTMDVYGPCNEAGLDLDDGDFLTVYGTDDIWDDRLVWQPENPDEATFHFQMGSNVVVLPVATFKKIKIHTPY